MTINTFYDLVTSEFDNLECQARRDQELFDELFRYLRADQRLAREGAKVNRQSGVGTIAYDDVEVCEFRLAQGTYIVRDPAKQHGPFAAKADAITCMARLIAKVLHEESRRTAAA